MELLATLRDFAAYRGVTLDPTDERAIIALEGASDVARRESGRVWDEVFEDEVICDGSGTSALVLPAGIQPVTEVSRVVVHDPWTSTNTVLDPAEYILRPSGILYRIAVLSADSPVWPGWPHGFGNITVTCTHGYALEDLPADVRGAVLQIASRIYVAGPTGGRDVTSETLGAYSVSYDDASDGSGSVDMPEDALATLRYYRLPGAA